MATFKDKISNLINQQVPEFVLEQHPKFLEFVKSYYSFMESAELVVTSVETTYGVFLESTAFGKFTRGETITGQTSNATATVLGEDLDNGRLFISAQDKFVIGETVLGSSSNASAIINNYKRVIKF